MTVGRQLHADPVAVAATRKDARRSSSNRSDEEAVLRLQGQVGNRAVVQLLTAADPVVTVQRDHHTEESKEDSRVGAIEKLSRFPKGTNGHSLSGVYRNFNFIARWVPIFGTGAGLPALIDRRADWLSQQVARDKAQRRRDALQWGEDEADAFEKSPDLATRSGGRSLAPISRGKLLNVWQGAGLWIPSWLKRGPSEE